MSVAETNKIKTAIKYVIITIGFLPFCFLIYMCFMLLVYMPYKESKEIEFVRNYKVNSQSIDDRIKKIKNVQDHRWDASEFNVSCDLILKNNSKNITLYFIKVEKIVYAASRRTADLFPNLLNTNDKYALYDAFTKNIENKNGVAPD